MNPVPSINPLVVVLVSVGASSLVSGFLAYVAFRIQFERFLARDTEREKHLTKWQDAISKDVEQLKAERNFHVRIQHCEEFIVELRDWKHEKADPHIRAMGALNDRVSRLESAA